MFFGENNRPRMAPISHTWGTTPQERELAFPCDGLILRPDDTLFRGVTIHAPPHVIFRWLCQMRVAPYSYDWIDNCGKASPGELIVGLDKLAIDQDIMTIFRIVDFEPHRQMTIRMKPNLNPSRIFGEVAASYVIVPGAGCCRLLVKLIAKYPTGIRGQFIRTLLPWGDLIMMRRQLLNFKRLAEQSARTVLNA